MRSSNMRAFCKAYTYTYFPFEMDLTICWHSCILPVAICALLKSLATCIVSFIHRLWPPILPDTQLKLHVYQSSVAVVQKDKGQWPSSCLLRPIFGGSRCARSNGKGSPGRIMGRFKKTQRHMGRLNLQSEPIAPRLQPKIRKKTPWLKAEPLLCEWFKPRGNNVTSRLRKGSSVGLIATAEETVCVSDFLMRVQVRRSERLFGDAICSGPIRLHCSPLSTFWTTEDGTVPTLITLTFTLNSYVLGLRTQNSLPCFHDYPYEVSPILTFSCVLTDKWVVILTRYHAGVSLAYCLVDRFPDKVERFSLTLKWLRLNKT